jgi:hypothetical protein
MLCQQGTLREILQYWREQFLVVVSSVVATSGEREHFASMLAGEMEAFQGVAASEHTPYVGACLESWVCTEVEGSEVFAGTFETRLEVTVVEVGCSFENSSDIVVAVALSCSAWVMEASTFLMVDAETAAFAAAACRMVAYCWAEASNRWDVDVGDPVEVSSVGACGEEVYFAPGEWICDGRCRISRSCLPCRLEVFVPDVEV